MAGARSVVPATNEVIATFGASGRDFSSIPTWEAAIDVDVTTGIEEVSISSVSATRFLTGEALAFDDSSATATFYGTNLARTKMFYLVLTGTPTTADTITGGTSTATADIDSIDNTNTGCSPVLEGYADADHDTNFTFAGATTTSSFFRILRPAAGEEHDGTPNTGFTISKTTRDNVIFVAEDNFQLIDVIAKLVHGSSGNRVVIIASSGVASTYCIGCIAFDSEGTGAGSASPGFSLGSGSVINVVVNCLATNMIDGGGFSSNRSHHRLYNCTAEGNATTGFSRGGNNPQAKNCISDQNGTDWSADWSVNSTNNSASNGTAPGSNPQSGTPTYIDEDNDDFGLDPTDSVARENGIDLSADGSFAFDDDIEETTRPISTNWDIGFHEAAAAGGDITLALDAGVYSLVGTDANLEKHSVLDAESASYLISGVDASLEKGSVVAADSGVYSLSGVDANLEHDHVISIEAGAYVVSGTDANLEWHHVITIEAGAYTIIGTDTNLIQGQFITAEAGSYSLVGTDAGLKADLILTAEAGGYLIIGTDVGLLYARIITIEAGAYLLTGQDVTFGLSMPMGAGSYALSGQDASLLSTRVITIEAGAYTIIGTDVDFITSEAPDQEGLEYTLKDGRLHYVLKVDRLHYTLPTDRPHYEESD